jgi:hypothetical protein
VWYLKCSIYRWVYCKSFSKIQHRWAQSNRYFRPCDIQYSRLLSACKIKGNFIWWVVFYPYEGHIGIKRGGNINFGNWAPAKSGHQQTGVRGGIPPAFTRTTGTSKSPSEAVFILLEVLLKPGDPYCGHFVSVSQQLLCLHVEDLTRQKRNHAKSNPTQQHKAGTRQKSKQTKDKLVHEYLFTWGPWRHQRARDVTNRGGSGGMMSVLPSDSLWHHPGRSRIISLLDSHCTAHHGEAYDIASWVAPVHEDFRWRPVTATWSRSDYSIIIFNIIRRSQEK